MSSCQLSCSAILGRSTAGTLGHPYPLTPAPSAAPVSELLLEGTKIHVQNILRTLTHQEEKSGHPTEKMVKVLNRLLTKEGFQIGSQHRKGPRGNAN